MKPPSGCPKKVRLSPTTTNYCDHPGQLVRAASTCAATAPRHHMVPTAGQGGPLPTCLACPGSPHCGDSRPGAEATLSAAAAALPPPPCPPRRFGATAASGPGAHGRVGWPQPTHLLRDWSVLIGQRWKSNKSWRTEGK